MADVGALGGVAVTVCGVGKRFVLRGRLPGRPRGVVEALRDVDLEAGSGTIHAIVGPNGSGKSTLLRILVTLLIPDAGVVRLGDVDVVREPARARALVGFSAGDERSVYWRLTGRQNLQFFAALHHLGQVHRAVAEALAAVELEDVCDRPVMTYSQGMLRRLGLARALLHRPRLLVLDEPGRSLDPASREHLYEVLRRLRREAGTTMVIATHDLVEAAELSDDITVLEAGRVVARPRPGDPDALRAALGGRPLAARGMRV